MRYSEYARLTDIARILWRGDWARGAQELTDFLAAEEATLSREDAHHTELAAIEGAPIGPL